MKKTSPMRFKNHIIHEERSSWVLNIESTTHKRGPFMGYENLQKIVEN